MEQEISAAHGPYGSGKDFTLLYLYYTESQRNFTSAGYKCLQLTSLHGVLNTVTALSRFLV